MLRIRAMTAGDVALGMRLSAQAGWNQLEADWRRAIDLGASGCFVAMLDGVDVGTVTTCRFGPVAWIAMMLVDPAVRRRGVGRALMVQALEALDAAGVTTIRLDATPLGQPLYKQLGFVPEYSLCRYAGTPRGSEMSLAWEAVNPDREASLLALDRVATATDRTTLLRRLLAEQPESVRVVTQAGRLAGYLASRLGRRAVQIGPCIAEPEAGRALFADACRRFSNQRVYVDVPDENAPAVRAVTQAGLTIERPFVRMCRGTGLADDASRLWACFGPEKG